MGVCFFVVIGGDFGGGLVVVFVIYWCYGGVRVVEAVCSS